MTAQDNTPEIVARAQALIDTVQGQLAASEEYLRSQGLDPEKVRTFMQAQLDEKGAEEARKAFEADMAAVEQEVSEEQARAAFANPSASGARRPRAMI